MTNKEFKYWIDGYLALSTENRLDVRQITIIKNHANLVKAVVGELHPEIMQFIARLDNKIQQDNQMYFFDFKKIAEELFS